MSLARYRVLRCTVSRCCSWSSHSTSQPPSRASSNLQPGAHLYWAGRRHETVACSRCTLPSSASLSLRPQAQLFAASKEDEHLVCKRNAACSAVSLAPACSQVAGFVDVSAGVFQRTGPVFRHEQRLRSCAAEPVVQCAAPNTQASARSEHFMQSTCW